MASPQFSISLSDLAPAEKVTFSFGNEEPFDLAGNATFKTDSTVLAGEAYAHPWLTVKNNSDLNAQEQAAADEAAAEAARTEGGTAIEAGLDQKVPVAVGDVAVTLAADDSTKTAAKTDEPTTSDVSAATPAPDPAADSTSNAPKEG